MTIQGIQDGQVYGADSPLYISFLSSLNEEIISVTLLISVWYGDKVTDEPADPNYRLERNVDSLGQRATFTEFNVAPFAKDVLRFDTFSGSYTNNNACWMKVEYIVNYIDAGSLPQSILGDLTIVCTNGYGTYEQGANYLLNPFRFGSSEINATIGSTLNITVLANQITGGSTKTISSITARSSDGTIDTRNLSAVTDNTNDLFEVISFLVDDVDYIDIESDVPSYGSFRVYPTNVYRHSPIRIGYLDPNGAISYLTFYGNNKEVSNYTRDSHQVYTGSNYGKNNGNRRVFRTNGTESITLNSDWVDESFFTSINEMLLSKYVFLQTEERSIGVFQTKFKDRVLADGGVVESIGCVTTDCGFSGLYGISGRVVVIPNTSSIDKMKNIDELINYQVTFDKAFNKKPTYL